MASIVSQPAEENAFSVSSYEKLNDIVDEIGYDICQVLLFEILLLEIRISWNFEHFSNFQNFIHCVG